MAAVNDCGQGDWFQVPNEVIAKYPFGKSLKYFQSCLLSKFEFGTKNVSVFVEVEAFSNQTYLKTDNI